VGEPDIAAAFSTQSHKGRPAGSTAAVKPGVLRFPQENLLCSRPVQGCPAPATNLKILHIMTDQPRPNIGRRRGQSYIVHAQTAHMPAVEAVGRNATEHSGMWISRFLFRHLMLEIRRRPAAGKFQLDVIQYEVFDGVSRQTRDRTTVDVAAVAG